MPMCLVCVCVCVYHGVSKTQLVVSVISLDIGNSYIITFVVQLLPQPRNPMQELKVAIGSHASPHISCGLITDKLQISGWGNSYSLLS